jgi:hypothetical protein
VSLSRLGEGGRESSSAFRECSMSAHLNYTYHFVWRILQELTQIASKFNQMLRICLIDNIFIFDRLMLLHHLLEK